jgi:hypothetical protein
MEFRVRAASKFNYNTARVAALNLDWGVSWRETAGGNRPADERLIRKTEGGAI